MKTQLLPVKPWYKLGMSKRLYLKARPWKEAKISRDRFESMIMALPQETVHETRIRIESKALLEGLFGKEVAEGLD